SRSASGRTASNLLSRRVRCVAGDFIGFSGVPCFTAYGEAKIQFRRISQSRPEGDHGSIVLERKCKPTAKTPCCTAMWANAHIEAVGRDGRFARFDVMRPIEQASLKCATCRSAVKARSCPALRCYGPTVFCCKVTA